MNRSRTVIVRRGALVAALAALAGCCDAAGPRHSSEYPLPPAYDAPSFVFTADVDGRSQLLSYGGDSVTRFVTSIGNDVEARSAAGLVVFSSDRDGNEEICLTNVAATLTQ